MVEERQTSVTLSPSEAPFDPAGDVLTTDRLDAYMDEGRPMLNNYTRHAKIGGGQHGEVYLCYKINTRHPPGHPGRRIPVAMKSVRRDNPRAEQFKRLRQQRLPTSAHTPLADKLNTTEAKIRKEIAIMKKCRHPHVVRLYEVIDDRMKDKIYMVMEYLAGGEVKWRNEQHQPILTVEQTRRIIRDAVLGLEYLHHQGIIHRDIKPANLLWTEDRRQVKIADFGVSHFSYAQRLASVGKKGIAEDPYDPILLDDSDLTRRAGTPSFLAPEIIYEHRKDPTVGSSSLSHVPAAGSPSGSHIQTSQSYSTPNANRPPITKSIDIWALGVTLYCLLFGKIPFVTDPANPASEWNLYNSICNLDWTVETTMGSDRVLTGGRHPVKDNSEGAIVLHLLDELLQKDPKHRITLENVKRNSWFLRDLPEPKKWLQVTSPKGKIDVSLDETSDAMSTVLFRWNWGAVLSRRISSLFRRSRGPNPDDQDARGAVRSDPHVRVHRHRSTYQATGTVSAPSSHFTYEKGKQRAEPYSSKKHSSKSLRSKSIERWPVSRKNPASVSTSAIQDPNSAAGHRRGSISTLMDNKHRNTSSQSSPTTGDKPRTRFAFFFNPISHWRPSKYSSQGPSPTDTAEPSSTNVSIHARAADAGNQAGRVTRRSEEALRMHCANQVVSSGPLTVDRRASSWGQGDQPIEFTEVLSLKSLHELNDHEMNIGAGGVSSAPRTPSRLSNVAAVSPIEPPFDEEQQYGPPCFDEDSSTIASAAGDDEGWGHGSDLSMEEGDEAGGDDSDDQDENAVTFSPRKRPQTQD